MVEELQTMEPRLRRGIVQCSMPILVSSRFLEVSFMVSYVGDRYFLN